MAYDLALEQDIVYNYIKPFFYYQESFDLDFKREVRLVNQFITCHNS